MKVDRNDLWTGLFSLLGMATFAALLFLANARKVSADTYPIKVRIDTLRGVSAGTEVTLLGLHVGLVDSVELVQRGVDMYGIAVLRIASDQRLWEGTRAAVVPRGVWGSVVELELPETAQRRRYLKAWATLQGSQGQSLETLVAQAEVTLESFEAAANALRATTATGILEAPAMKELLTKVGGMIRQYELLGREARGFVVRGGQSLGSFDETLSTLRGDLDDLDAMLARREPDLAQALKAVPKTLEETQKLMARLRTATDRLEPRTQDTFIRLERVLRDVEELMELLKQKPSRVMWGKPSGEERDNARKAVDMQK
jgi:ABC-type transporter Mla subunit MlaD